jgi:hypothetical protein
VDGRFVFSDVVRAIFKVFTARRLYKSFGVKGLSLKKILKKVTALSFNVKHFSPNTDLVSL